MNAENRKANNGRTSPIIDAKKHAPALEACLAVQQAADIAEQFIGRRGVVPVFIDQAGDDFINFFQLLFIGRFRRCRDFHNIL